MKSRHTRKWVDQFKKITQTRNKTFNRSINTIPLNTWNNTNNVEIWRFQFVSKAKNVKEKRKMCPKVPFQANYKYEENDYVRISAQKTKFHRFYSDKQVDEVSIIVKRYKIEGRKLYQIKDSDDNIIKSRMYEEELVKANVANKNFEISKIIKERMVKGKKQSLVQFYGYKSAVWVYNSQMNRICPKTSNV